jgi:hypothetical protein
MTAKSPFAGLDKALLRPTRARQPSSQLETRTARADQGRPTPDATSGVGTNGRTDERMNERPVVPRIIRHSFDIRQDQLLALAEIQAQEFAASGRKPKMGELAQEALDLYIASKRRENGRTNE